MCLLFALLSCAADPAPAPTYWKGTLSVGLFQSRRLFLEIRAAAPASATLDSIDVNAMAIPSTAATIGAAEWQLEFKGIDARFAGKIDAAGAVAGKWKERGQEWPAKFAQIERRRPQEPLPPFPYRTEEIVVRNETETLAVKLAGTLTLPAGPGPHPAVVLVTGSGAQNRDEALLGHRPFLVLADALARGGIASIRLDDRGVGGSDAGKPEPTTADFAGDIHAAVRWAKARPELEPGKIGIAGHSEGGVIAPMVAARHPADVAFVALLAGPGVPGDEVLFAQSEALMGGKGELSAGNRKIQEALFAVVKRQPDRAKAAAEMRADLAKLKPSLPWLLANQLGNAAFVEGQIAAVNGGWMRYFVAHDPRPDLAKLRCPILALNGGKDLQVLPGLNLPGLRKACAEGGVKDSEAVELPNLNHLFQTCKTGGIAEYAEIEETMAPAALEKIVAWVRVRTGLAPRP